VPKTTPKWSWLCLANTTKTNLSCFMHVHDQDWP
jgi:hypothetical protein